MDPCSITDIEQNFDATIAAVAADQQIDPICSTSNWIVPVAGAFAASAEQLVYASDAGFMALLRHETANGPVLSSFDAVWGFSAPLVGPDPTLLLDDVVPILRKLDFSILTISGIHPDSSLFDEVQRLGPAGYTDTADRCVADLSDGFDAWLMRRSARFRRSLRVAVSRAQSEGVTVEAISPQAGAETAAAFERLLAVESTSWKTDASSGLVDTGLGEFTRAMAERFAGAGRLRLQFAQLDGRDVGYVIGARIGDRYRGFQHSFNKNYPDLSIGKLLQYHAISVLAEEEIRVYDMGMQMDYKHSYADRIESTLTAVIPKR